MGSIVAFFVGSHDLPPGPPPYWWVQPIVVAVGTATSILVAVLAIATNRRIARLRATLDLIKSSESEPYYQNLYLQYKSYRTNLGFRDGVLNPVSVEHQAGRTACFDFLNHYELVAIGIRNRVIDEEFYRRWMGYVVIRDWKAADDLIRQARRPLKTGDVGDVTAYVELEKLAKKWDR